MSKIDDIDFEYLPANDVRVKSVILLGENPHPYKVVELQTSKTGKHGKRKITLVGISLLTEKKVQTIVMSDEKVAFPKVSKEDHTLIQLLEDNYIRLLSKSKSSVRDDVRVEDDDLFQQLTEMYNNNNEDKEIIVTTTSVVNVEMISGVKYGKTQSYD